MKNYLKLVCNHVLFSAERLFYFEDTNRESAQTALTQAQDERARLREEYGFAADACQIVVYQAKRFGRIPGVREIGKTTGMSLQSVRPGTSPIGVTQPNLIGLPRRVA